MAKKPRERGSAGPREPATMEMPDSPWGARPYESPEVTRAAPVDEDATGLLVPPTRKETSAEKDTGGEEEEAEGLNRTLFSAKAVVLAHLLREKFHRKSFGRAPPRFLRVDEPEGPSTAGGLLARQPLSLVAHRNAAPSAVCGWVDTSKAEAQLRSYELVRARYEAHQGIPFNLTREQYDGFLDDLVEVLSEGSIKVRVFIPEPASATTPAPARPEPRGRGLAGQLFALLLVFVLGLLAGRVIPWDAVDAMLGRPGARAGQLAR